MDPHVPIPSPIRFTPAEWAALLPVPPPEDDPGAAAREPFDLQTFLAALPPLLRLPTAASLKVPKRVTARPTYFLHSILIVAVPSAAAFGLPEAAAAFSKPARDTWVAVLAVIAALELARVALLGGGWNEPWESRDMSWHPMAGAARWAQATRATSAHNLEKGTTGGDGTACGEPTGDLFKHHASDPLCPCPGPSCGGKLVLTFGWMRIAVPVLNTAATFVVCDFLTMYSAFVTLGNPFWTTWWTAILGALALCFGILGNIVGMLSLLDLWVSWPSAGFVRRTRNRALNAALASLLDRCTAAASCPDEHTALRVLEAEETFSVLHSLVGAEWTSETVAAPLSAYTLMHAATALAGLAAFAVTGGCVPAWIAGFLLLHAFSFSVALGSASARNAGIFDHRAACLAARHKLRILISRHPSLSPAIASALRARDALLSSCIAQADAGGARLFGSQVREGAARGAVATLLTVAVGMWGLLRGAGVVITVESTCPS